MSCDQEHDCHWSVDCWEELAYRGTNLRTRRKDLAASSDPHDLSSNNINKLNIMRILYEHLPPVPPPAAHFLMCFSSVLATLNGISQNLHL